MKAIEKFWKSVEKKDNDSLATQKKIEGVTAINDIPYVDDGNIDHTLFLVRPTGSENKALPVIVVIHGGGWYYGNRTGLYQLFCSHLALQGFAVIYGAYRLAPSASYADQIQDVFGLLNWIKNNAEKYHLDANNVFGFGDSAGGHLVCLTMATMQSSKLKNLFGVSTELTFRASSVVCGVPNPSRLASKPLVGVYFKPLYGKHMRKSPMFAACDFSNNIPVDLPPTFIVTCYGDVFKKGNLDLYDELKSKGYTTELHYLDAPYPDGNKLTHVYSVIQPWWEASIDTNTAMCNFFKKYLTK